LPTILELLAPHQADIMGVVVESTYRCSENELGIEDWRR
jgi:hypothetical protein